MPHHTTLHIRLLILGREIKQKERDVKALRAADRTTYKTYLRARKKLASKKYEDVQGARTKKWFNMLQKCVDEQSRLAAKLEIEEEALVELKIRRAECVRKDKDEFEKALLLQ